MITEKGKLILEYLEKYSDSMYKLALARLIYKEHPEDFNTIEDVRASIRYYTGATGEKQLQRLCKSGRTQFIGVCQPKSEKDVREDYVLPTVNNNCLLLFDVHAPYHEESAIDAMLEWGKAKGINTIILGGDFMDFYGISHFIRDSRKRNLQYELDAGYELLYYIQNKLHKAKIFYLPGNHEYRLDRYLMVKAPELLSVDPGLGLDYFLHFSDFGINYLRHSQLIRAGNLFIGHGDEFNVRSNPVNPARTFALKGKVNYIGGHFHVRSEHSWRRMDDIEESCWSAGCLCGLSPEYRPYNEWTHGFVHLRLDHGFRVFNAKITNGKVM
jgi:predicted phosphodiesterase